MTLSRFLVPCSFHATAEPLDEKETTRNSYVNTRVVDHRNWYENCLLDFLIRVYKSIEGMYTERVTSENVFSQGRRGSSNSAALLHSTCFKNLYCF